MNITTDVTIISTNINKKLLTQYTNYYVVDKPLNLEHDLLDLLMHDKVIFFNALYNLNAEQINRLYANLKEYHIEFINITNNIEEVLYTKNLIVYEKEQIIMEGETLEVLKEEKILKRVGLELPFMVELSLLLKDYDLIDKIYLSKESLVKEIWN